MTLMGEVLEGSKSGYYAWSHRPPAVRSQENERLSPQIPTIHPERRQPYGAPRIHATLHSRGFQVGRHRVARRMSQAGICVRPQRRFKPTTDSTHSLPIAPNRLERNFTPPEPDQAWVADIPYIPTLQGWWD
jgi:transposase InsO family protein